MIGSTQTTRSWATGMRATRARASVPAMGPCVPTATVHLAYLVVAAALCALVIEAPFWLAIGLLLACAGTFVPNLVHKGCVILVLGLSQLWREPSATDVVFYVLLAGVHLLYTIGSLARELPWQGRMQTRALMRPLQRFVLVQSVVQIVAVSTLITFGDRRGTVPGLSIVAAAVLGVVAIVLGRGLRRARRHE